MRIRTFREGDAEAVIALWHETGIARPWLDLRAEIREKRRRDRSLFLVAIEGGAVIGSVMGAYDGRRGWIYHLAVDTGLRSRGIGRALMAAVEARMAARGIVKVNLQVRADNLEASGFYERLGYANEQLASFGKWLVAPPARKA